MGASQRVTLSLEEDTARAVATRLVGARRAASALDDYPGDVPATLDAAYAIQARAIALQGEPVAGWKVGRIFSPMRERFGSDRLAGPIFASKVVTDAGSTTPMTVFGGGFGAVESEFVFVLRAADPAKRDYTLAEAAALVDRVHVGIEIASSPLGAINTLGPAVTVSDFGNNNGLIVGPEVPGFAVAGIDTWPIETLIDGVPVGTGQSAAFVDGTLGSVRFLLELLARRGIAVPAGTLVSSGAITGVHVIGAGQSATARFDNRIELHCTIKNAAPEPD